MVGTPGVIPSHAVVPVLESHFPTLPHSAALIEDPCVKAIAAQRLIGSIALFSDSTDLLEDPSRRRAVGLLYRGGDSRE